MSVVFSGNYSGRFTATGNAVAINVPAGIDFMHVRNQTVSYAAGANTGAEFYWQRGDANGRGTIYIKTAATNALQVGQIAANAGFFLQDTTLNVPGASVAITGITNGNPPVVQTGSTAGLVAGQSIVRIYNTVGALQLGGLDFTIDTIVANTSFELAYMSAIANASPGAGSYRIIPFNPYFYPSSRFITKVIVATSGTAAAGNPAVQADEAIVTLSVNHNYTVGQEVRFVVPQVTSVAYGMTELNGLKGTIIAIGDQDADGITNTIRVDIDVQSFSAFAFPLTADVPFTPAQVVPIGENTAEALSAGVNILGDATENQGQVQILLMAGTSSPAGAAGDVITYTYGKSFNQ